MTTAPASATVPETAVPRARTWSLSSLLLPPATMIVILAGALLFLMTPIWMHFALNATTRIDCYASVSANCFWLSDRTISELFVGPGTFSAFAPDEAAHMRDVRVVLWGFLSVALVSLAVVVWKVLRDGSNPQTRRAIGRGGLLVAGVVLVVGAFAAVAFGVAFELFHRIFFPGGNWAFSADSVLIRLYPYEFWQLTAGALGVLAVVGGLGVWVVARRRARVLEKP